MFACVYICVPCVCACRVRRGPESNTLEQELWMVVSHHMGAVSQPGSSASLFRLLSYSPASTPLF